MRFMVNLIFDKYYLIVSKLKRHPMMDNPKNTIYNSTHLFM